MPSYLVRPRQRRLPLSERLLDEGVHLPLAAEVLLADLRGRIRGAGGVGVSGEW